MTEPSAAEVLEQLDSACRYLFPDRPPHRAFGMTKDLIEALYGRLAKATKLIEEGNLTLAILIEQETALRRIRALEEKNVPKYAQQIAREALAKAEQQFCARAKASGLHPDRQAHTRTQWRGEP